MTKSDYDCSLGQVDSNADECKPVITQPEKATSGVAAATRDRLEAWSFVAQIVTAVAVIGRLCTTKVPASRSGARAGGG